MYSRVLVPVDGSKAGMAGVEEAVKLCHSTAATLRLVHVINELIVASPFVAGTFDPIAFSTEIGEKLREDARALLSDAESLVRRHGVQAECQLLEALGRRAGDEIVRHAREWPADIIVMGKHGRRGIRRMVMGSDAELVVRTSSVPVLLVPTADHAPETAISDRHSRATTS